MTSLTDILAALQNGVTAINGLATRMGGSTTILSFYGFNGISTAPTTVVTQSSGTDWPRILAFHNPSPLDVLVYPSVDGDGNPISVVSSSPGGGILIYANGGSVSIDGGSTMAWAAISTGTTGALTVMLDA